MTPYPRQRRASTTLDPLPSGLIVHVWFKPPWIGMPFILKGPPLCVGLHRSSINSPSSRFNVHRLHRRTTAAAMEHGIPANFEVHFLHSDHPRHGFRVMSMDPFVFYEFMTPVGFLSTHTIVRAAKISPLPPGISLLLRIADSWPRGCYQVTDASGANIVTYNWFGTSALGTITWPGPPAREAHMGELVMPFQSMPQ
jgi:hypothetical protein